MTAFNDLAEKLLIGDIGSKDFFSAVNSIDKLRDFGVSSVFDLQCLGLDVEEIDEFIKLKTKTRNIAEQRFCVVDIETNGCALKDAKIIEIGAVIVQNGEIIDEFNSLAYAGFLSDVVVKLTGITQEMLEDAPSEALVLEQFRGFIKDSVFVAHNVEFDYNFLSYAYLRHKMPPLLNRRLCTISLGRKTFEAPRYGLQALREHFEITEGVAHRAFWDAKSAAQIFNISCKNLCEDIVTTEDLLLFAKENREKKIKAQRKLPIFEEEV